MVGNYGASLVDRELRARAALPPAALVLAQDGRVPGRALEGHVLPADPWRFTVHAGSARDQHLQVLRQPADGSSGRRKRPRAALRLELELADGTQVALQVEPVPGGVAIEMAAPGAVARHGCARSSRRSRRPSSVPGWWWCAGVSSTPYCRRGRRMPWWQPMRRRMC
ncbi:hypothetical protein [Massilia sp. Se16.2.3]|uniref:hypothetical protein n=1 Tax=Massilia sp. Se16.2.3 TaxID=2709303 RepID=UPI001602D6AB|nr:hypothetical protein [Massilia sp. Se16.2.3]QNA99123.1 hypothetical protein G4G31_10135 [Massilia sp. Se16.2.3]